MSIKIKFNQIHIDDGRYAIAIKAASLINQFRDMHREMRGGHTNTPTEEARLDQVVRECRIIGETAAFFGGYDAMLKLNHAIIDAGGDSNSLGYLWDGIAGWIQ